jgi:hypothetical protein
MGMDLNSIILTYNILGGGSFALTVILPIAKAYLYNGREPPAIGYLFGDGYPPCTVAPPYVLDNSATDYMMAFCPGDTKVYIGALTNAGLNPPNLHWDTVNVSHHGVPPQAQQPAAAGGYTLDTGDNRFENRSLQVGSRILNTATVSDGTGFAIPSWYNFNIGVSPPL